MSEPTRDPIQDLENFGTGGIAVNPLEPAAVRRLGDKRRRRQNTIYGAVAAVVVAVAIIPTAILVGNDDGGDKGPGYVNTPDPTPTPTTTASFPDGGVEITSESDVAKLVGTSDDFKQFILAQYRKAVTTGEQCPDATHQIGVQKYDPEGFALGNVNDCGGYVALWTIQDGRWKEALGTQEEWRCGDLTRFRVPEGFAGACYGSPVLFGPGPVGGFSIGMTTEQVEAAGGVIEGDPAGDCAAVTKPGLTGSGGPLDTLEMTSGKVIAMFAAKNVVTARGIGIGSSEDEVKKAYPVGHYDIHHYWHVAIDDGSEYEIGVDGDKQVFELLIQTTGTQGCYG